MANEREITESTLEILKLILFGNQYRAERTFTSQAGHMVYICALRQLKSIEFAKKIATISKARFFIINTEHFEGLYIEFFNLWILFYCPTEAKLSLGVSVFNQSLDSAATQELVNFGKSNNITNLTTIGFDIFIAMYETYYEIIGKIFDLNENQLHRIKLINSIKEFINNYKKLILGDPVETSTHIGSFSWIYYVEIQAISLLLADLSNIKIHDIATNTGNLPILISQLQQQDILPIQLSSICCSDYNDVMPIENIKIVQNALGEFNIPISVERLDVRATNPSLYEAEVIIANDILEHFYDEESEKIFHNLWKHTKNLLIIHVPIEENPNRFYGHFTNFTNEKLNYWASTLTDCNNLTQEVLRLKNLNYSYDLSGFLFLQKKKNINIED